MASGADPPLVGHTEEDHLRRFVAARNRGDDAGATRCWAELVEVSYDRVATLVALWSYRKARLDEQEREEAVQRVLVSMWDKVRWSFEGSSMGELHGTLEQLVHFRCADVVDEQVRHRERHASSLDRPWVGDDGRDRGVRPEEVAEAMQVFGRAADQDEAADLVEWVLVRMPDERQRTVLEHTVAGTPAAEIAAELRVTVTNIYKIRERALTSARAILEEQER